MIMLRVRQVWGEVRQRNLPNTDCVTSSRSNKALAESGLKGESHLLCCFHQVQLSPELFLRPSLEMERMHSSLARPELDLDFSFLLGLCS